MKPNWRAIGLGFLFSTGLVIVGLLSGYWATGLLRSEKYARWQNLGTPPGGAQRFVALTMNYSARTLGVRVAAAGDAVYRRSAQQKEAWVVDTLPKSPPIEPSCEPAEIEQQIAYARFRGHIRDCAKAVWSWEWTSYFDELVILEDGSVWIWRNYHPFSDVALMGCGFPLGFLIVGWFLKIITGRIRRSKPQ